ncbi:MAG: response regulator [Proteobacteria bacterium]|nr:response regulator [Pseudomonadota bacterium]
MTDVESSSRRSVSQGLMFASILLVFLAVASVIIYTNKTLNSIEKNLPTTLVGELNSLSMTLEDISAVVSSARVAAVTKDPLHIAELQSNIRLAHSRIVELRDTYVANNMVNASAFHAVIAPAIADLQIWMGDGVSGYPPDSSIALSIIRERITEAFHKAARIRIESQVGAQNILEKERNRLEIFQRSVNILFIFTLILAFMLISLLFSQIAIKNKEIAANKEIQQQHALLNSLLHHIPLGVSVWDKDHTILHLNTAFTQITGYDATDLRKLSDWSSLAYPDPLYRQQTMQHWKAMGRDGSICEYRVTCKDGKVRDIEFRDALLPDMRGISTLTDVTEWNRNEKALQESRLFEARAKKMESLGLLAGGVAHDLNNILSGIVSYPELLLFELPEGHKMRRPIEIMRESGMRASAIVQDLLTVARGVAVAKEPINLRAIIEDYLQSPDFRMIEHYHPGITTSTNLAPDTVNIMGSRVHIRKILMNLVSNSFEASSSPGQVTISLENKQIDTLSRSNSDIEEGEYVVLTVADQGKGIGSEDLEKIFEPFYSKKVMGRSGTGLGLTVVWNVVQDHNGYINVASSEVGTQFTLYFPVTSKLEQLAEPTVDLARLKGRGETLLVVDDVSTQRLITSSIVEKLGYRVESVPSGESALEYLQRQPVDLVILDMIMSPGINGRVTYERIIQMYPGQKAIIVSGYAETDDVKEALRLGAGRFLKKPLMIRELAAAIHEELSPQPLII